MLSLLSTNLKCVVDAFFTKEFTASFKKTERWPRDNLKVIFLFYFWFENMLSPNIRDCPLNNSLNPQCLSMPYGSVVSRRFYKDHRKTVWFEYGQIIFYILRFFYIYMYLEKFRVFCFQLIIFLISLSYIDFVLYSINFKTHV